MPIYRYHCHTCNARRDLFSSIEQRDDPTPCPRCAQLMTREIAAPMVLGDYAGYECPRTGRWIEGRKAHQENLKRLGCRVLEPGEKEDFDRNKKAEELAFTAKIEGTVESLIHEMPIEKREALVKDIQNGASVDVIRGAEPST